MQTEYCVIKQFMATHVETGIRVNVKAICQFEIDRTVGGEVIVAPFEVRYKTDGDQTVSRLWNNPRRYRMYVGSGRIVEIESDTAIEPTEIHSLCCDEADRLAKDPAMNKQRDRPIIRGSNDPA